MKDDSTIEPLSKTEIPDRKYYKIGEVASIVGVPAHVLRFWETEFKNIRPQRTSSGQRLYRRKDLELVLRIKHYLHEKRFTIQGARNALKEKPVLSCENDRDLLLEEVYQELRGIRELLE